ncbi:MAG: hypothetical protein Q4A32_08505 [Lachnospiraceae bacterium]|nr:hypothetical protein [Lachnospiraceae bacterium]
MRKVMVFMLWALCIFSFIGCGSITTKKQNAMELSGDGKVKASSYGSFDKDYYDAAELKRQIQAAIDEYNAENGDGCIELGKCSKGKDGVFLVISYASTEDYAAFNGVICYAGQLDAAVGAGIVSPAVRITSSDGRLKTTVGELNDKEGANIKILAIEEPMVVDVPGEVLYVGEDVLIGKDGICTAGSESLGDVVLDEPCYILYQ